MKEINKRLNDISELIDRVDAKVLDINTKLDELIKALHAYDDDGYGESSFEAFQDEALEKAAAKYSEIDILSWDVDGAERRMDIIGQNGNEGLHYDSHHVTNEEADEDAKFSDYGMRIAKEVMSDKDNVRVGKDNNNIQPKQKQYYKNKRSKRSENKKFTQDLIPKNK